MEDEKKLHIAIKEGSTDVAAKILDMGLVDVNCLTEIKDQLCSRKSTPMLTAVSYSKKNMVKFLLERGADPNMADTRRHFPLQKAAWLKDPHIFPLLLDRGAEPNEMWRFWHALTIHWGSENA